MKAIHVLRTGGWMTRRNEDRRVQSSDHLPIQIFTTVMSLLLTLQTGPARAGSVVRPEFPDSPWVSTSGSIPPGVLAHRMECLLTSASGDTIRLSISADSPPLELSDRLHTEIKAGRARLSLRVAGGEGPLVTQSLEGTPALVPGKPPRLTVPLTTGELHRFLDRQLRRDVSIQNAGRPLSGLTGSANLTETGPGRYELLLPLRRILQLRNPGSCTLLLFAPEMAYRVRIPTGIGTDGGRSTETALAVATPAPEAGLAPQVLLLSPLSVDLGTMALNKPGECSLSLTSWGSSPRIIPLTFSSADLRVENLPSSIRLEPGQTTPLVFNVAAKRSGRVSGKVKLGVSGGSVEVTGTAQGVKGRDPDPKREPPPPPELTLSAESYGPQTFRIRWKSPGEGFSYRLVCRSVSSPETPATKFDFKGRESRAVGEPEFADFSGLPADGTYTFELTVLLNGEVVQSKSLVNKRLTY